MADVERMNTNASVQLLHNVLGDEKLAKSINQAKLLLVGCGGIGCEVIKNLMLMGFHDVTMIDLDTIDVSNLNRQFLFNKTHINQSKAQISAKVAKDLFAHTDQVTLTPIHGSIQSAEYNVDFFRQFTIVVNALDNRQARTHVNRMCLAADVPLIESGSEGYFGQTFVIKKNVSMCYECDGPKQDGRTFASCTIRNTPSLPIHCIVWAKHLFAQLFGEEDADNDVSPDMNDPELNGNASNKENVERDTGDKQQVAPSTRKWAQQIDYDSESLFDKFFRADIEYLHTMDKLWKNRTKPIVLKYNELDQSDASTSSAYINGDLTLKDQRMWSLQECYQVFSQSVQTLKERLKTEQFLVWDKDDEVALNFVTSVSNLRSHCFHIERKSKFDVKSMAGNIIPAISSTNSIVGGLMVLQIINLLRKLENMSLQEKSDPNTLRSAYQQVCKHVYLRQISTVFGNLIAPYQMFEPNPSCLVCNTKNIPEIEIALNFAEITMCEFVEQLLLKRLNFVCPDIQLDGQPIIIWSKDDADEYTEEEANEYRTNALDTYTCIQNRSRLRVYDLIQNLTMIITLTNEHINVNDNNGLFYKLSIIREADADAQPDACGENVADSQTSVIQSTSGQPSASTSNITANGHHGSQVTDANKNGSTAASTSAASGTPASGTPASGAPASGGQHEEIVELSDEEDVICSSNVPRQAHHDAIIVLDEDNSNSVNCLDAQAASEDDECEIIEQDTCNANTKEVMPVPEDVDSESREDKRKSDDIDESEHSSKKLRVD